MLILDKHHDTFKKLVTIYGSHSQTNMLAEKMAKLTTAMHRYQRKKDKMLTETERKKLEEEVEQAFAEMLVLAEQVTLLFNEKNIGMFAENYITKQKQKTSL